MGKINYRDKVDVQDALFGADLEGARERARQNLKPGKYRHRFQGLADQEGKDSLTVSRDLLYSSFGQFFDIGEYFNFLEYGISPAESIADAFEAVGARMHAAIRTHAINNDLPLPEQLEFNAITRPHIRSKVSSAE